MNDNWIATYRLQLHAGFSLYAAAEIIPYLARLGISHVYLSPCLQAAPGSLHGYDVADPTRINEELGGEAGWEIFQTAIRDQGLKVLLDIVPNHMVTDASNIWWEDILASGPNSPYMKYFDVFPDDNSGRWKIHLCTLGEPYGEVLEKGQFAIDLSSGKPRLKYFETTWPLNIASWKSLLSTEQFEKYECFEKLALFQTASSSEISKGMSYAELLSECEMTFLKLLQDPPQHSRICEQTSKINKSPINLDELLEAQYYQLHWWKLEGELVNYRRFFNIGTLIGVRVEDTDVFEATHHKIAEMIQEGDIDGLRIDHPDGLRDPAIYFQRVREKIPHGRVFVEKILDTEEVLPQEWAVDGTVGYDFLSKVDRLWMDEHKADNLNAIYFDFTGGSINFPVQVREKKQQIIDTHFQVDINRLTTLAEQISRKCYQTRDLSKIQLRLAIQALTVGVSVYRTYRSGSQVNMAEVDAKILSDAFGLARANSPGIDAKVFDFLYSILFSDLQDPQQEDFVLRWQQLTPAVMAKGAEDTTFYCFDRLVSCNEVGAQPSLLGISTEKFHQFCSTLGNRWPANMLATSTHDNKRSEDVRARISVISEIPDKWASALQEWSKHNESAWKGKAPDRHAEYLLYQTLIGAWPISPERSWNYMLKACREAKIMTSWHEPNEAYELAVREFTEAILDDAEFVGMLEQFVEPLILPGRINSLSQTLIKMTAPGTPDFYQGTELWDLSLVDPDNRRPVDFALRERLLAEDFAGASSLAANSDPGLFKLQMIAKVLKLRRDSKDCFEAGAAYRPLAAQGSRLGHLFGYYRGDRVIVLVPRFTLTLAGEWEDTLVSLPEGEYRNIFTDRVLAGEVNPERIFGEFPVAVLIKE